MRNRQLAQEMVAAMADRPVVVLRAHGLTSAAESVERAVLQAISVDTISRLSLQIASAGGTLADLPDDDAAELPDLGNAFNETIAWRHELARLQTHRSSRHTSKNDPHRPLAGHAATSSRPLPRAVWDAASNPIESLA